MKKIDKFKVENKNISMRGSIYSKKIKTVILLKNKIRKSEEQIQRMNKVLKENIIHIKKKEEFFDEKKNPILKNKYLKQELERNKTNKDLVLKK